MKLSEKIIRLRKGRGLSQEELAERLGVSRQAVSRWESGTALPDAGNLRQISRLFEVSADYLLDEERESPEGPAAAVAQKPHRTNGKVIAGGYMAMLGFWGLGECDHLYRFPVCGGDDPPQGMEHRPQHLAVPVGQQFDRPQLEVLCAEV